MRSVLSRCVSRLVRCKRVTFCMCCVAFAECANMRWLTADCPTSWLADLLPAWLAACLLGWLVGCLPAWWLLVVGCCFSWRANWLTARVAARVAAIAAVASCCCRYYIYFYGWFLPLALPDDGLSAPLPGYLTGWLAN